MKTFLKLSVLLFSIVSFSFNVYAQSTSNGNECCERLMREGRLSFSFNEGSVQIQGNTLQLQLNRPPNVNKTFEFGFNLLQVFCSLRPDQIFAEFISEQEATQQNRRSRGRGLSDSRTERGSSRDIVFGYDDDDRHGTYTFSFSKQIINGNDVEEISITIVIDAENCKYDLQVSYNEQIYEHAMPFYSAQEIIGLLASSPILINGQRDCSQSLEWKQQMLKIIGEMIKIEANLNRSDAHFYMAAKAALLQNLQNTVNYLLTNCGYSANSEQKNKLLRWRNVIQSGRLLDITFAFIEVFY